MAGQPRAELVHQIELGCISRAAGVAADQDVVEEGAHDGRVSHVPVSGAAGKHDVLPRSEMRPLLPAPVVEERPGPLGDILESERRLRSGSATTASAFNKNHPAAFAPIRAGLAG
ncbi:MAG: hypothetical protein WCD11_17930 [Solirubrobacteraceae bacterium]